MTTIAVTGHRPKKLGGYDLNARRALGCFAIEQLYWNAPDRVITGMALGWDQAIAGACIVLGIPFVAAIPMPGHSRPWPREARDRYEFLLSRAQEVAMVSDVLTNVNRAMQKRNEWMVDRADRLLALWDGTFGGTCNCVYYAQRTGVPVDNIWASWEDPALGRLLG
jgi:uncharacterized phage-like protein YoqJ